MHAGFNFACILHELLYSSHQGICQSSHQTICRIWATTWLVLSKGTAISKPALLQNADIKFMIYAAGLPHYIFFCHKAVLDSALAPHSTVHLNTLSCWKQQRPQSEHISDFTLSMLLLTCGLKKFYSFMLFDTCINCICQRAKSQTNNALVTSGVNVARKVKWWRQWRMW